MIEYVIYGIGETVELSASYFKIHEENLLFFDTEQDAPIAVFAGNCWSSFYRKDSVKIIRTAAVEDA